VVVTYEGSDKISEEPEPLLELEDKKFIMYVGRPTPHKNLYRLVSAFVELKKTNPELKLVLAGKKDANYKKLIKWVEDKSIEDVVFTGFIPDSKLRWLYENCQAYVFPSLSEGFGLPGLEAMRHGAPVVSSNATCLPEIYGNAAIYFDPFNVDDMAQKIDSVLKSPAKAKTLVEKGFEQLKNYSWKKMAQETLDIYKNVLEED
jgi:glycosyltransferase involved in cell wall biosynthesis